MTLSVSQLRGSKRFDEVAGELSQKDGDGLLAAVGYGIVTPGQLLAKLLTPEELRREDAPGKTLSCTPRASTKNSRSLSLT